MSARILSEVAGNEITCAQIIRAPFDVEVKSDDGTVVKCSVRVGAAMLLVESFDDTWSPEWEGSVDDFIRDNGDGLSDEDVADVSHLEIGKTVYFGGGAGARFRVTRTA